MPSSNPIEIHERPLPEALEHLVRSLRAHPGIAPDLGASLVIATLTHRFQKLPAEAATSSRDYGRGYAQAIRDVLDLLQ